MKRILLLSAIAAAALTAQPYTRGIGVYPGDPKEDFGPTLVPGGTAYRNVALEPPGLV
ncbi:MAG: hypothetical protein P4L56_26860 [Candidatus Sulfopaludibacter sp.]|nr:hypothetical protein [Candidatus Sulfopaludibacter sp.]